MCVENCWYKMLEWMRLGWGECAMSTDIQSHGHQHVAATVGLYFCLITWTAKVWNLIYLANFDLGFGLKMGFKNPLADSCRILVALFLGEGKKKLQAFSVQSSSLHQRESSIEVPFYKDLDVTMERVKQTLWHIIVKVENWYKAFLEQEMTTTMLGGAHSGLRPILEYTEPYRLIRCH